MAIRLSNSFINTTIPGSYSTTVVQSNPTGVSISGNILIIGEADGGADLSVEDVKNNYFTPDQVDKVAAKYIRGPIVDAMRAISSPSADADITGSANRVYILKTNAGTKASAEIPSYGTLTCKNYGIDGNKYSFQISQAQAEVAPAITSGVLDFADPSIFDGLSFSVRVDGGVASVITLGTGTHATIAALATEIAGLLPAGLECAEDSLAGTITISHSADLSANSSGSGKTIELIDSTVGDLAALELSAGLVVSSAEPSVQVDIVRIDNGTNESFVAEAEVALEVGYAGTSATLTISGNSLTTTVVGGIGSNLSLFLSDFATIKDLAAFINSQAGYSASVVPASTSVNPAALDKVSAIGIAVTGSVKAGRIKKSLSNFKSKLSQSVKLDFVASATAGLPAISEVQFLSSGSKGSTSSADVVAAFTKAEGLTVNFVVPLFSRNASEDLAEGLTDSSSTYTIDAINALAKSHVLKMSTAKMKKQRQAFLSVFDAFTVAKSKASSLANERVSLCFQKVSQVNSQGSTVEFLPWYAACVAAGMQAAGFYKGITNKFANIISVTDPSGFDSGSIGDLESALESGLLIIEKAITGNKWVSDQTTYSIDTNFVYNSIQAMYAADLVALDLTQSMQAAFVGKSLADVDANVALSFLASKMDAYRKNKLIAASSDAKLGYKNAKVTIQGPVMEIAVEIKLATTLYFIPIFITISEVTTQA